MAGGGGRKRNHATAALIAGIAAAGLFSVVWLVVRPSLPVALAIAVLLLAATTTGLAVALGWWDWLSAPIQKRRQRKRRKTVQETEDTAAMPKAGVASDLLERLLVSYGHLNHLDRRATRKLLKEYENTLREHVVRAVEQAWAIVTVPPEVTRCAERPHSVAELEHVRDWLHMVAERRAPV
jgi:hypothetical protein